MLWSRSLVVVAMLFSSSVYAHKGDELKPLSRQCELLLGLTLKSVKNGIYDFDKYAGVGMRGALGSEPSWDDPDADRLRSEGIFLWGHSFAVRKSIEDARVHDANFKGLSKVAYFISDVDVSDLEAVNPKEDSPRVQEAKLAKVRARYRQIEETAQVIYFDDSEAMVTGRDIRPLMVIMEPEVRRRLIDPDKVDWISGDDRGDRFGDSSWVFPKIRGELKYSRVFESGSRTIEKILAEAAKHSRQGYTYTFNQNFQEALDMARDQVRREVNVDSGAITFEQNSRYLDEPFYLGALEAYKQGKAISIEVRDPNGKLVAGVIGEKSGGNLWALDTIFYGWTMNPDGTYKKSLIDFAKEAVLAGLERFHEHNINIVDAGMVTPFTASIKGEYVSRDQFALDMTELNARGPIEIDFSKPYVFKKK